MTEDIREKAQALQKAKDFIEEITSALGKYPELNGTPIVSDARRVLRGIEETLNPGPSREEIATGLVETMVDMLELVGQHPWHQRSYEELFKWGNYAIEELRRGA